MLDPIYEFVAAILDFFYGIVPNYAVAIVLLTMLVMVVTAPLTLKGTKGMIQMQLMQPEIKKIQEKHKGGDRQVMNQELMEFYQSNGLNPLGGCLPLLVQAPFFFVMFRVIEGMTRTSGGIFDPKYLSDGSNLHEALAGKSEMLSFGLDLAESTSDALAESIIHGLPYLILLLIMVGAQYLQQKQVSARSTGAAAMPQQKILLRIMPAFFGLISLNFAAALVVYWVTSSIFRIGLQWYITRSLYAADDSLGAQARRVQAEAKGLKDAGAKGAGKAKAGSKTIAKSTGGKAKGAGNNGNDSDDVLPSPKAYQPSSKKKKKPRGNR